MNIIINLINRIYVKNIENTNKNLIVKLFPSDNLLNSILTNLNISDSVNVEQYENFKKKLLISSLSPNKKSFFFTNSLFFSLDNPLYEINNIILTIEKETITARINYSSNIKYLYHELTNPLNTIYNASILINLESNLNNRFSIENYTRIINNQIDNCLHLTKSFIESENDIQHINLFQYLKSYLNDYYSNYNYLIQFDNDKLNNYVNMDILVKVPKNIVYMKIILDNIFKNAIIHNKSGGLVSIDFKVFENYTQFEIVNTLDKDIVMGETENNWMGLGQSHNNTSEASYASGMGQSPNNPNLNKKPNIGQNKQSNLQQNHQYGSTYMYSNLYNYRQSHFIGMELIAKLCNKLSFKWNLVQNNDKIVFYLDIPCYNNTNSQNLKTPYKMNFSNSVMVCV